MPRKGIATVKKANKDSQFIYLDSDDEEFSPPSTPSTPSEENTKLKKSRPIKEHCHAYELENVDPAAAREQLNLSKPPKPVPEDALRQPRQDSTPVEQSKPLANPIFPASADNEPSATIEGLEPPTFIPANPPRRQKRRPVKEPPSRIRHSVAPRGQASGPGNAPTDANTASRTQNLHFTPKDGLQQRRDSQADIPSNLQIIEDPGNMMQGGAYIAPGQQRNMRACMVCSIVRTQQQFMSGGCPNCEDVLELAGNAEQINDCTSQVFEGLITVMDTKRSWVARYQRLEGYVPGVYATQVEGILPEDVIVAVESAGINYVPRDGSEQEMLPKD